MANVILALVVENCRLAAEYALRANDGRCLLDISSYCACSIAHNLCRHCAAVNKKTFLSGETLFAISVPAAFLPPDSTILPFMRFRSSLIILCMISATPSLAAGAVAPSVAQEYRYAAQIDALSVRISADSPDQAVSAWDGGNWTSWQELHADDEQDPALRESNLVMLPPGVTTVRFRSKISYGDVHPIRVSRAPARFDVASAGANQHRILSRAEWGADESLLVDGGPTVKSDAIGDNDDNGSRLSARESDCKEMYARYPSEFTSSAPVSRNAAGENLRWPQEYSPSVRLLVVHHTAIAVDGDPRPGIERMRALYQYHAVGRGWGDIGYHYVIDDEGRIYEGRAGGDSVVGGHVYCNNAGTIGVALMGNFDKEQPTQSQGKSLQWLLHILAQKYGVNVSRDVVFHGKALPAIVGHRQLVSTDCPGLAVWSALDQVRGHVMTGDVDAAVVFPEIETSPPAEVANDGKTVYGRIVTGKDGLASLEETIIEGRPGGEISIPILFRATRKSYAHNTRIARITRSAGLGVWLEKEGALAPARDLRIPVPIVKKGQSVVIRIRVRLPMARGTAALKVGSLNYTFEMSGRAARTRQLLNTGNGAMRLPENAGAARQSRIASPRSADNTAIRILLTPDLPMDGLSCGGSPVRTDAIDGGVSVAGYFDSTRAFRGQVECHIIDGRLALINVLPMEDYLLGLSEEPDSEPYEKQRAFAIAARTYAFYYTGPVHRKFPGMPYDGDDSPARFQAYRGHDFEQSNPRWLRAVRDTEGKVLTYKGETIRAPYFSADDGKTRSPQEAGWKDFPFPEIFTPKDDPWCSGMTLSGHGVGMSGCGAAGQARERRTAEEILKYYYPGTDIERK